MIEEFNQEIEFIKKLHKRKEYFKVIFVGIQLIVKIADYISESLEDMAMEDFDEDNPRDKAWKKVSDIYHKTLRKIKGEDAPRTKALQVFYDVINHTGLDYYDEKEVISLMHKVERVISFRNKLAHNFFEEEKNIKRDLPIRAKECLDLIYAFQNHPWF